MLLQPYIQQARAVIKPACRETMTPKAIGHTPTSTHAVTCLNNALPCPWAFLTLAVHKTLTIISFLFYTSFLYFVDINSFLFGDILSFILVILLCLPIFFTLGKLLSSLCPRIINLISIMLLFKIRGNYVRKLFYEAELKILQFSIPKLNRCATNQATLNIVISFES